eukprot:gene34258-42244_t
MFEIIAAYGGPGLSMGVPGKCVIMLLMLMGISRGLPSRHDECVDFKFEQYCTACGYHPVGDNHQVVGDESYPVNDKDHEIKAEEEGGVEMIESGDSRSSGGGVKGVYNPLSQQQK